MNFCLQSLATYILIGFAFLHVVTASASGENLDTAKTQPLKQAQPDKAASARIKSNSQRTADETRIELERLHPQTKHITKGKNGNAFASTSWYVPPPPPPPAKPTPPPEPVAPPMPFTFLGLYEESPRTVIMLVKGDQVFTVSIGDVIESTYRIDRVERGSVEMTYLPLNIKQSLNTGNSL
jgi:hypothetical protein